jgi:hypothetical protein
LDLYEFLLIFDEPELAASFFSISFDLLFIRRDRVIFSKVRPLLKRQGLHHCSVTDSLEMDWLSSGTRRA